jgi:DNA-binding SARP family transcriptional activator
VSTLEIRLLGHLEISQLDARPQPSLTWGCQRLLAYLLLNTGKMCRREELMDVFWRDSAPKSARRCLNSALWRLRRELEPSGITGAELVVSTDAGEIGFNWDCEFWLDVQRFEERLVPILRKAAAEATVDEAAQAEQSLALYRGELLEGIYDDWALVERERLRILHLNALSYLMEYYAHKGAYARGMEYARAILKIDPLREDTHRSLMQFHVLLGQRALAVEQYRVCAEILERELGVPPMEETALLYAEILNPSVRGRAVAAGPPAVPPETELQLRTIMRTLDQAHALLRQATQLLACISVSNAGLQPE